MMEKMFYSYCVLLSLLYHCLRDEAARVDNSAYTFSSPCCLCLLRRGPWQLYSVLALDFNLLTCSFWLNRWQGPCTLSPVEDQRHPSILLSHIWSNTFLLSFRIGSCHTMSASHNAYHSQSQTFAEKDNLNWDRKITDYFSLA